MFLSLGLGQPAKGQSLGAEFADGYQIRDLGGAAELPANYGGLVFKAGEPDTLLVAGNATSTDGKIFAVKVKRDATGHITGLAESAVFFANAPGLPPELELDPSGGIESGLSYGPEGVLFYTSYHDGGISQIKPGSTGPDKQIRRRSLGFGDTWGGGLLFVPTGFPGAGRLKIVDFDTADWHDTTVKADGAGTFDIMPPVKTLGDIAPSGQGVTYARAGLPGFPKASVLIACNLDDRILAYEVDDNGDPLEATRRVFITDFGYPSGATVDAVTGDFLFTSSGQQPRVVMVGRFSTSLAQVRITAPADGSVYTAPASFPLEAEASQAGGSIARVEFYQGDRLFAAVSKAPYATLADSVPAGAYAFTAVAIDGNGNAATSAVTRVTVVNVGPEVTLSYPTNNTSLPACSSVLMTAVVQPGNSEIAAVEFFDGTTSLEVNTNAYDFEPYTYFAWHRDEGAHTMSVKVTAKNGLTGTAVATNVVIRPLPLNGLALHHLAANQLMFCFKGLAGSNYVWETSDTLSFPAKGQAAVWTPFLTNTLNVSATRLTNQYNPSEPRRFYRVRSSQ